MLSTQPDAPAVGMLFIDLASNSDTLFLTNEVTVLCGIRIPLGEIAKIGVLALCSAGGSSSWVSGKPSKSASICCPSAVSWRTFLRVSNRDNVATLNSSASSACANSAILAERLMGCVGSGLPLVVVKVSCSSDELMRN